MKMKKFALFLLSLCIAKCYSDCPSSFTKEIMIKEGGKSGGGHIFAVWLEKKLPIVCAGDVWDAFKGTQNKLMCTGSGTMFIHMLDFVLNSVSYIDAVKLTVKGVDQVKLKFFGFNNLKDVFTYEVPDPSVETEVILDASFTVDGGNLNAYYKIDVELNGDDMMVHTLKPVVCNFEY